MLAAWSRLIVLMLDGWEQSTDVTVEFRVARELVVPIEYFDPGAVEGVSDLV